MTHPLPTPSASEADRVRASSAPAANSRVEADTRHCLQVLASADRWEIDRHLAGLDREWDVERYLQLNMSIVSLAGVALGALDRRFLVFPAAVFGFFLQHALQGWCPPLPLFRSAGARTRREINRERYALKALRGDFEPVRGDDEPSSPV